jgi:hypothetical protein
MHTFHKLAESVNINKDDSSQISEIVAQELMCSEEYTKLGG